MSSIRRDLSLGICATILLVGLSAGMLYYIIGISQVEEALEEQLLGAADEISEALAFPLWNLDHEAIEYICRARLQSQDVSALKVTEDDGTIVFSSGNLEDSDYLRAGQDVVFHGYRIGRVELALNRGSLSEVRQNIVGTSILTLVAVVLGAMLVIQFLLKRYLTAPLERLRQGVERLTEGEYDSLLPTETSDEIRSIVEAFNNLSSRLVVRETEVREHAASLESANMQLSREVDDRKRAEQRARQARNSVQSILDSMPSILIAVDTEGRVTQWNSALERAEIATEDALGRSVREAFPQLPVQEEDVRRALATGSPVVRSKIGAERKGSTVFLDVVIFPLESGGGAVIRVDDVSSRVRIEEIMIQTEKMMSVGGLAAGMAHEINNPLGIILQGVQGAFRRLSPTLPANAKVAEECGTDLEAVRCYLEKREIDQYLSGIQEAGSRAAKIVANMLNFSRSNASQLAPNDLNELIEKTIDLASNDYDLKKKYDFRKVNIVREFDSALPQVTCTATEIEQVFLNLLKNAAQALAEHEHSDGGPSRIVVRTRAENGYAVAEVEDNGPGLDEDLRKRVFEPFFTTKKPGVGTGLGLSVSYFIITQNHKGTFSVESKPGKGAKFIIRLPLTQDMTEHA